MNPYIKTSSASYCLLKCNNYQPKSASNVERPKMVMSQETIEALFHGDSTDSQRFWRICLVNWLEITSFSFMSARDLNKLACMKFKLLFVLQLLTGFFGSG